MPALPAPERDAWYVGVDIGGTFTDVVAVDAASGSAASPQGAVVALRSGRGLPERARGADRARSASGSRDVRLLLHGTTLATNAIIERRLATTALVTTEGFRDVLEIGRHWRSELYDPFLEQLPALIPRELRFEVRERRRRRRRGARSRRRSEARRRPSRRWRRRASSRSPWCSCTRTGTRRTSSSSPPCCGRANGWLVCASSELSRELREYERSATTVLNAALMPLIDTVPDAARDVARGRGLSGVALRDPVERRCVDAGRGQVTPGDARPLRPGRRRGRVHGARHARPASANLICFDMGGTSADVSMIGDYEPRMSTRADDRRDPDPAPGDRRALDRRRRRLDRGARRRAGRSASGPRARDPSRGRPATGAAVRRRRLPTASWFSVA